MVHRILRLIAAGALVALSLPGATMAASDAAWCTAGYAVAHSMPIPADMRTAGVHRFERHFVAYLEDGTSEDWGTVGWEIELAADAPAYENVMLRVVSNWGLLADGSIDRSVATIRLDQKGTFYSQTSWLKEEPIVRVAEEIRYETRRNRWTDWIAVPSSPARAYCVEIQDSLLRMGLGWAR